MTRTAPIDRIETLLKSEGLMIRGGLAFEANEDAPAGQGGRPARSVLLVGHAGTGYWQHFQAWLAGQGTKPADPLDSWSKRVIGAVAGAVGARAVFPSDKPYLPFQQWAMRAEGLKPSPFGVLMHPQYGPWHAWRGALLFDELLDVEPPARVMHPCDACSEKPCLTVCPVGAIRAGGLDVAACVSHVDGPDGASCRDRGCLARNVCPAGVDHRYRADAQAFHQAAFLAGNRRH
ncbi:MAG: hypothetical protein R3D45_06985 [Rhizobiaceae bacterium]